MSTAVAIHVPFQRIKHVKDDVVNRVQDNVRKAFDAVALLFADYVKTADLAATAFNPTAASLHVTATAAANTGLTLTLPDVAGQRHYIAAIHITRQATAALAGGAVLGMTTTNLPGSPIWSVGNAMVAGGTSQDLSLVLVSALRSSVAGVATTIVLPAPGAAVTWRANVSYYTA